MQGPPATVAYSVRLCAIGFSQCLPHGKRPSVYVGFVESANEGTYPCLKSELLSS